MLCKHIYFVSYSLFPMLAFAHRQMAFMIRIIIAIAVPCDCLSTTISFTLEHWILTKPPVHSSKQINKLIISAFFLLLNIVRSFERRKRTSNNSYIQNKFLEITKKKREKKMSTIKMAFKKLLLLSVTSCLNLKYNVMVLIFAVHESSQLIHRHD